jgi:hypothetical protein
VYSPPHHARGGAAAVEIDLVVAVLGRADLRRARQPLGAAPAQLQREGVLLVSGGQGRSVAHTIVLGINNAFTECALLMGRVCACVPGTNQRV